MDELATLDPSALIDVEDRSESAGAPRSSWAWIDRVHDDAGILVVKHARSDARAGLRREAEVLEAVGASLLVRLVALRDLPDSTELVLRDTGGPSLAAVLQDRSKRPSEVLERLAEACDTVARLHAAGWAHGRLTSDHVLLTPRGRVRLCSLRSAMPIDLDPTLARDDRAALLRMVDDWVASTSQRRSPKRPVTRIVAARVARRTRRLADAPDPVVLARILRRSSRPFAPWRNRSAVAAVAIAVSALAAIALVATAIPAAGRRILSTDPVRHPTPRATTRLSATSTTAPPGTTTPVPSTPSSVAATTSPTAQCTGQGQGGQVVDVDGDGCAEPVSVEGNSVRVGTWRFRIGDTSDVVAVGDWDCDGRATAAVLDPSTGAVHAFDGWADADSQATAALIGRVEGATALSAPSTTCGPPVVSRPDGTSTVLQP